MAAGTAEVVVIGLGAMGAATLHALARRGVQAIGIDRFHPPHDRGSSHGESRISRLAVGEGAAYAPLVRRSHEIWRALEAESGESLLLQTGGLIIGPGQGVAMHHGQPDFVRRTIAVAEQHGIAHDVLDAAGIAARFPQFALRGDEIGCHEPGAGLAFPERCIAVQLRLAAQHGARLQLGTRVLSVRGDAAGVSVETDGGTVHAARAVLTAGPWLPELAGGRMASLTAVYRQTLHWFQADDPDAYTPGRFPVFIWMHGDDQEDYFYGFPVLPGRTGVKVASERYARTVMPDSMDRDVAPAESQAIHARHVAGRLRGIGPTCLRTASCLYTVTPDAGFIVDELPGEANVIVASACSGHGFKHSAALGELLAEQATGAAGPAAFSLARYA